MHRDLRLCYQNWTSPLDAAKLLDLFVSRPLFTEPHQTFIKQTMIECETGKDRLAQPLEATDAIIPDRISVYPKRLACKGLPFHIRADPL